jgi:Flp pilus assembly protein TadG
MTKLAPKLSSLRHDTQGAIVIESLVAMLPLMMFFFVTAQVIDGYAAHLVVRRAASAATRAAVVVLPDDGTHYPDAKKANQDRGKRHKEIEYAANAVVEGSPALGTPRVRVSGKLSANSPITVTVTSAYRCLFRSFCGNAKSMQMTAHATLPYQGASYTYDP